MDGLVSQQQHAEDLNQRDLLSAATAFFKWRQAALKANFRRELEGILEGVAQEEEATERLQKQLHKTQERLDETAQALSKSAADHRLSLAHVDQLRVQNDELFRALEAAEGASRTHAEQARAANMMHQEEVKRRQDESKRSALEIESLREQCQALVSQQQALLESLAQRDRDVAESSQEAMHHKRNAARLQEDVERLEAIARATGERAAAAEAQAAARNETITKLYAELSGLRERYHVELSELKAARMAAADVDRMRERMDSLQAANDSLVAARDELRASLEGVMAKLAAAEQRLKRQAAAATLRESIIDTIANVGRELVKDSDEAHVLQATTRLSSELDMALANNADLAERLTSADAVVAQQQGHIRRMAEECAAVEARLREALEHRDAQHRLNAEMAAELQRLAAESALGPILALDKDGNLVPQERPPPAPPAATAPATSQLEAQSTAVRVILADKAFGLGALCQAIAKEPGSVQAVRAQLGECRALAEALRVEVDEAAALLAARPFEAEELARKLPILQDRLSKTETCMVAVREDLMLKQVHAVGLEARVLAAESALRSGSSLLQGWSGLLAEVAAAEDGRLEPDVRLGLREELKTREDALHRAVLDLAAAAPPLLGGDPGYAAAQVALREAGNAMMDLALTLGDRLVDAPATRTRVLATEQLLLSRAEAIARFREVLARAPGEIAEMVERLTAIIPDVQAIGPAVEEMLRCVQHYLAAGKEPTVDVVALQGEVLMLRGLVRSKDMAIQALEAVGTGIRTGSPTKRAQKMVPLEALHAAERARDAVAGEKAALQSRMVDQRVRLVAARHRLVNYMASLRTACEAAEVFYKWRAAVAVIQAERAHADMVAAQKEQARVEQECRDTTTRIQAELEAMRVNHAAEIQSLSATHIAEVTALTTAHTAEVASMQTAHAEETRRAKMAALEAAETRVKVLRRVMKEKSALWREGLAYTVLYFWRFRVRRQVEARHRWRDYLERLRAAEEPEKPTYREILYGPRTTVARRLRLRHLDPSDLRVPQAVTGAQVARAILKAWRGWAYVKRQVQKVDALTEAVPMFMENIGDRRRLERAWLGLRLWTAAGTTARAHQAISDYEAAAAEAAATKAAAESAVANMEDELRQEQGRREAAETEAAARAAQVMQLMPGHDPSQPYGLAPGQMDDNPYALVPMPGAEVGTQYLPHAHTVLSVGAQAPEHAAAANAVAAARAAGLDVNVQPMTTAMQHQAQALGYSGTGPMGYGGPHLPPRVVGLPGGGPSGNMVTFGDLNGLAMPPVAGPSQASIDALTRRRSAPGSDASQEYGYDDVSGPSSRGFGSTGGGPGSGVSGRASSNGRMPPSGRGPLQQVTDNQRGRTAKRPAVGRPPGNRTSTAGVARPAAGQTSGVATLAERAERLMRAVDAISANVADTAALLSPRTKVLQVDAEDATEPELGPGTEPVTQRASSRSPTRRLQGDGTVVVEYKPQVTGGRSVSPPHSPTRATDSAGPHTVQHGHAQMASEFSGRNTDGYATLAAWQEARPTAVPSTSGPAPTASAPRRAQSAGRPSRSSGPAESHASGQPRNSVRVLLDRASGRKRPQDARSGSSQQPSSGSDAGPAQTSRNRYSHVGSRLHEETVSTLAKKATGRPVERGAVSLASMPAPPLVPMAAPVNLLLPPSTNTPGPVTAAQLEGAMTGSQVARAPPAPPPPPHITWPHVPASSLPRTGSGAGPNTADSMRWHGDLWSEARGSVAASAGSPRAEPVGAAHASGLAASARSDPSGPMPQPPGKIGKVVRFERVTPAGAMPAGVALGGESSGQVGSPTVRELPPLPEDTRVTYIELPSPVRVSVRLPGA